LGLAGRGFAYEAGPRLGAGAMARRALFGVAVTAVLVLAAPAAASAQDCSLPQDVNCNAPEYGNGRCTGCQTQNFYCAFYTGCTSNGLGCPGGSTEDGRDFSTCPPGQSDKHCYRYESRMIESCSTCLPGWGGTYCQYSSAFTCNGHGYVSDYNTGACMCDAGYGGPNCCPAGWTGPGGCSDDIDECVMDPSPCLNGGGCTNTPGSYTCQCVPPYDGANCEISDRIFMDGFDTPAPGRPAARFEHP
jgi:hypothetical protein